MNLRYLWTKHGNVFHPEYTHTIHIVDVKRLQEKMFNKTKPLVVCYPQLPPHNRFTNKCLNLPLINRIQIQSQHLIVRLSRNYIGASVDLVKFQVEKNYTIIDHIFYCCLTNKNK